MSRIDKYIFLQNTIKGREGEKRVWKGRKYPDSQTDWTKLSVKKLFQGTETHLSTWFSFQWEDSKITELCEKKLTKIYCVI